MTLTYIPHNWLAGIDNIISSLYQCFMDDFGIEIYFSVMNDNNDFVTFVFMVLFENHWLLF